MTRGCSKPSEAPCASPDKWRRDLTEHSCYGLGPHVHRGLANERFYDDLVQIWVRRAIMQHNKVSSTDPDFRVYMDKTRCGKRDSNPHGGYPPTVFKTAASAIPPFPQAGTKKRAMLARFWSGRRDSNPRPSPWQGDALPLSHFRTSPVLYVSVCKIGASVKEMEAIAHRFQGVDCVDRVADTPGAPGT